LLAGSKNIKIKYAEIDFTSYHSFLRVRRDQFRQNCKKTHPIEHVTEKEKQNIEEGKPSSPWRNM
jgi:hypothetical protein